MTPDREPYDLGTPFLRMEREGHLAWCTIDRPGSRNASSSAMYYGRILHQRYGRVDRMTMDWSLFRGPEAREGMQAFAEKRAPSWVPQGLGSGKRL